MVIIKAIIECLLRAKKLLAWRLLRMACSLFGMQCQHCPLRAGGLMSGQLEWLAHTAGLDACLAGM